VEYVEYVAYHRESGYRILPGDPIMDRLGEVATFVRATDDLPGGQPIVVVQLGPDMGQVSMVRPDAYNLDLVPETAVIAPSG